MEKIGQYITKYVKGKTPKELFDVHSDGMLPYLSPDYLRGKADPEVYAYPSGKTVQVGDGEVIVLWDGSNAGEIFISKKGILASTMVKLDFNEEVIDKPYYSYSFQYLEYFLKAKTAGSGIPHADKGVIKRLDFFKPQKPEQEAIAAILSKVDATIQATENTIKAAEKVKRGLMQNLLTGKLKPDGTWRKENEFYKDEKFGNVPVGWKVKRIKDISVNVQYGLNTSSDDSGLIPMFRMNNIIHGKMVASPMIYISLSNIEFEKYKLVKGDILFNRTNSMDLVGKVGIFDLEGDYVFASYLIKIQVNPENDANYINYCLNSYPIQIRLRSKATPAVSQANINAKSLRNTLLILPEKEEQILSSKKLSAIEGVIDSKRINLQTLQRLKKSLMQNLLTGKVRVDVEKINQLLKLEKI